MKDLLDKFKQTRYEAQEVYPQTDYSIGFLNTMDYVIKTMEDKETPSPVVVHLYTNTPHMMHRIALNTF